MFPGEISVRAGAGTHGHGRRQLLANDGGQLVVVDRLGAIGQRRHLHVQPFELRLTEAMADAMHFVEANGLKFAYLEEGSGPLVVLLHGFPDTAHTWDDLRPRLAAKGYRAVSPFMRGYHPSAIPARDADQETIARDPLALIEALGADDAIMLNTKGHVACATVGNLFFRIEGNWVTPPRADGILPGLARKRFIAELGAAEPSLSSELIQKSDAGFVCNSLGFTQIKSIDGRDLPGDLSEVPIRAIYSP